MPRLSMSGSQRKYSQRQKQMHNATCAVSMLMNERHQCTITALGFKRNEFLTAMIELTPFITECLNTSDIPEDRRIQPSGPLRTYYTGLVIFI